MADLLEVRICGSPAGVLTRDAHRRLRFEYSESYRARSSALTPLSVSMPIRRRAYGDQAVSSWLSGLLPDNGQVLERWARHFQGSPSSPFSLLRSELGRDCAGAVQFMPVSRDSRARVNPNGGAVVWLTDADIAERLRDLRDDATSWLGHTFDCHFTLAGAQAKTALRFDAGDWCIPPAEIGSTHIIKPAIVGFADNDINEHLCLSAARRCGLHAARTQIISFEDEMALVVERYDRQPTPDGSLIRIHQEDLCQALALAPSEKYQSAGGPGPARIVELLREAISGPAAEQNVWRFAEALIWNWLIAGTDAHAKNYSLLLSGDQVRLAPLYDVASALPYGTNERQLKLAMTIGESYDVHLDDNHWPQAARDLGLNPARLLDRARELATLAPTAFADAAREPSVRSLSRPLPEVLVQRVSDRCERCLQLLKVPHASGTHTALISKTGST